MSLAQRERRQLEAWARQAAPREACGTLIGRQRVGVIEIAQVELGANLLGPEVRDAFDLDPMHVVAADHRARQGGMSIVGVWHSHPNAPAVLSRRDRASAARGWCHAVVSLRGDRATVRAWLRLEHLFVEVA